MKKSSLTQDQERILNLMIKLDEDQACTTFTATLLRRIISSLTQDMEILDILDEVLPEGSLDKWRAQYGLEFAIDVLLKKRDQL